MSVSIIQRTIVMKSFLMKIFHQGYNGNRTEPVIPASGAYIFTPVLPEALPVSLIRQM